MTLKELLTKWHQDKPGRESENKKTVNQILAESNTNKDGKISRKEWLVYVDKQTHQAMKLMVDMMMLDERRNG